MNIVVNTTAFTQELRLLNQIVSSKPALPILSNVLIKTDETGMRCTTTDTEVAFSTVCRAVVNEPGGITLPVKTLLDIVEQLPDADLQIYTDQKHVRLQSGSFRGRVQTLLPNDFPQVAPVTGDVSVLPTVMIHTMIHRVRYAIADKIKYVVNGALLVCASDVLAFVATDGKRLSITTTPHKGAAVRVIIPTKALDLVVALFNEPQIQFSYSDQHLFFASGDRVLVSRMLEGKFPSYDRIIPRENDKTVVVDRPSFASALRRVSLVSEDNQACYFAFSENGIEIGAANVNIGDATEHVDATVTGDALKVCCNWRYVLDFLEASTDQSITLTLKTAESPIVIEDHSNFMNVIMLMRM